MSTKSPLPLLPPPPPPPPPPPRAPPAPAPLIAYLPNECRPKVDSLTHLMVNIDNNVCFDEDERQKLRNSTVGNELMHVLQHCREHRAKTMASKKLLKQSSTDNDKTLYETNLLQFQTCLLRNSCPLRMQKFEQCWTNVSRTMIRNNRGHAVSSRTCKSERQALERCAGNLVAQSVREAIEDPLDDDEF